MSYLLDANVLSEGSRPTPNLRVMQWLDDHEDQAFLSAITVGELHKGVMLLEAGRRRGALKRWLEEVLGRFEGRILPFDQEAARIWGELYASEQRRGRKPPSLDSLVAATAKLHGLTVVSRNAQDFPGVEVENPWDAA